MEDFLGVLDETVVLGFGDQWNVDSMRYLGTFE